MNILWLSTLGGAICCLIGGVLHPASMQFLRSNSLKRTVAARMGISFVSGLERIMRVACRPSIPGIMMFMRIRRGFSLVFDAGTPYTALRTPHLGPDRKIVSGILPTSHD